MKLRPEIRGHLEEAAARARVSYSTRREPWESYAEYEGVAELDPKSLLTLLQTEGVMPCKFKDDFVFLSVAAHLGKLEHGLAQACEDQLIEEKDYGSIPKPIFIASDITNRMVHNADMIRNRKNLPLSKVAFALTQASAFDLPYPARSVDVEFDQLGAIWHLCDYLNRFNVPAAERKKVLLSAISKMTTSLKRDGSLIIDAFTADSKPFLPDNYVSTLSTDRKIEDNVYPGINGWGEFAADMKKMGFSARFIGEKAMRLAIFTKNKK